MFKLLFASTNAGKYSEVQLVAKQFGLHIVSVKEIAPLKGPVPDVVESADTYSGNAQLKADEFYAWSGFPALADDAGLEVEALGGGPGVWSARYAGEPADSDRNIEKMLRELGQKTNRRARFVSFLFARLSSDVFVTATGLIRGNLAFSPRGAGGFGYDSIFVPEGFSKTLAEIKEVPELGRTFKTHRILALEAILPQINQALVAVAPHREQ